MACQSLSADPGFALYSSLLNVFDRFHGGERKEERLNECVIRSYHFLPYTRLVLQITFSASSSWFLSRGNAPLCSVLGRTPG